MLALCGKCARCGGEWYIAASEVFSLSHICILRGVNGVYIYIYMRTARSVKSDEMIKVSQVLRNLLRMVCALSTTVLLILVLTAFTTTQNKGCY